MKNKKELKIGQEVFVIERNLNIETKKIIAIVNEEKEIKYKIDSDSCGGVLKKEFYLTKHKAEVVKQDFLDNLKFKVGDLLVFKYKEYGGTIIEIGRIINLFYKDKPYGLKTSYKNIFDLNDEGIVLKVNNEYIENFGKLQGLDEEFEEANKKINEIKTKIHMEHELLEKELNQSFKKQYKWTNINQKPLFKDRFDYQNDYD